MAGDHAGGWRTRRLGPALLAAGLASALVLALALTTAAPAGASAAKFPRGFLWGTALAGFQAEAGQGKNIDPGSDWFEWLGDPGNIAEGIVSGEGPAEGPGHWRWFRSDLDLAADELNNNAFRFSVEWSRIFPRSTQGIDVGRRIGGRDLRRLDRVANKRAVRHYRRVLRAAERRGLTPFVTLHHWTIPSWLHDPLATRAALEGRDPNAPLPELERGGWLERTTVREFRKYAAYLAHKLGRRADFWSPINEPMVILANGFVNIAGLTEAYWPPGVFSFSGAVRVLRNLERANTVAYNQLHRRDRRDSDGDGEAANVGPVMNMIAFTPADPGSEADRKATENADYLFNRLLLDAVATGDIDRDADGEISGPERGVHGPKADFVGLNYYFRGRVTALGAPLTPQIPVLDFLPATSYESPTDPGGPPCPTTCSEHGAELFPRGFRRVLGTAGSYGLPVYVTETGIADSDDDQRPEYLRRHLRNLKRAIRRDGVDARGFFHWSLTDNLEWVYGYEPRFGLYSYDHETLERTPRPSARLYGRIAGRNGLPRAAAGRQRP